MFVSIAAVLLSHVTSLGLGAVVLFWMGVLFWSMAVVILSHSVSSLRNNKSIRSSND